MQGDRKGALFVDLRGRLRSHLRTKSFPCLYQYLCQFLDGADKVYQSSLGRCVHQLIYIPIGDRFFVLNSRKIGLRNQKNLGLVSRDPLFELPASMHSSLHFGVCRRVQESLWIAFEAGIRKALLESFAAKTQDG